MSRRCLLNIHFFAQKGGLETTFCGGWWRLQDQRDLQWLNLPKVVWGKSAVKFGQDGY